MALIGLGVAPDSVKLKVRVKDLVKLSLIFIFFHLLFSIPIPKANFP